MQLSRVLALLQAAPALGAGWVYANTGEAAASDSAQAATWGGLCVSGHEQSPINVVTSDTVKTATPVIVTSIGANAEFVKNTGHGFQLFETNPNAHSWNGTDSVDDTTGTPKGYSMIGGAKYDFYQVHWHTPSENAIDGQLFPLEAHFVHQLDDDGLHGTYHNLAVIGLMYEMGTNTECNAFLDQFWGTFPVDKGYAAYTAGQGFDLNAKLSEELSHGYYHWYGSLTTPPCTEGVSWNLLKKREKVCPAQVRRLEEALAATQNGIGFNNRVVQPLYHRFVVETGYFHPSTGVNNVTLEPQTGVTWLYAPAGGTEASPATQAETWKGLCATGHEQSPINVITDLVKITGEPVITTHMDTNATFVKNTGHGFQLFETSPTEHAWNGTDSVASDASRSAKGYSMIAGEKYNFYQVHWHTPSENTIDGRSYPLEAHFVHQLDDPALHGLLHRLAVVGLMYEMGTNTECNAFLDQFWGTFPSAKGVAAYTGGNFDLNAKLSEELSHGYYHWRGSLTTPPCTEGVSWNLLKKTEKVCQRQVTELQQALAATQNGIGFNNRVVQPLYHRVVTLTAASIMQEASSASRHAMWCVLMVLLLPFLGGQ